MKKFLFNLFLILVSINLYSQTWSLQTSPVATDLNSICAVNSNIVWACGPTGVCLRTTNSGVTWIRVGQTALTGNDFYTVTAINEQICILGAADGGLWKTTNGGSNWSFISLTPTPVSIDVVHMFDANNGFALSDPASTAGFWLYYITTNSGTNWTAGANRPPNAAGEAGWNNSYMALDTGHIWWGTNVGKIWKGGFRGPFTSDSLTYLNIFGIAFNDLLNGCATGPSIAITTNGGSSWTYTSFTPTGQTSLKSVPYSGYMWLGTTTNIYRSTNNGGNWTSQINMTNTVYDLTFVNINSGWACTAGGKIYQYTDIDLVNGNNNGIPTCYSLEQNYPNPFNPTTNINFSIPKASNVSVKIYDVLGNEVMTVVDEFKNAGKYSEEVNASNLSSGVYFYTIKAGDFTASKKMSLVK